MFELWFMHLVYIQLGRMFRMCLLCLKSVVRLTTISDHTCGAWCNQRVFTYAKTA